MANLTARFQLIDQMSQKMADIANNGESMLSKWESAGDAASAALDGISSSASNVAAAADGVASSIGSIEGAVSGAGSAADELAESLDRYGAAADEAAEKADYWTNAVGGYDKAMLEASYSTKELVDMGLKSTAALDDLNDMMALCEKSSDELSKSVEAAAGIHDDLTAAVKKTGDQLEDLMQNELRATPMLRCRITRLFCRPARKTSTNWRLRLNRQAMRRRPWRKPTVRPATQPTRCLRPPKRPATRQKTPERLVLMLSKRSLRPSLRRASRPRSRRSHPRFTS